MSGFREAFPDLNFWGAADLIAEGDYVVGRWEGGGTHTGSAFSDFLVGSLPAATGRKMRFTGTTVLRIKDGKIAEEIGLDDGVTALQQLGLIRACGRYQMAAVLPQVEDRAMLNTNLNSAQTRAHHFEQLGLRTGDAHTLRTPAEIELGRFDLAGQAVVRPHRVATLMLIGFLRRRVVTRESEQIAKQPPDLIAQISSLTHIEDLVRLRGHISLWLFRYDVNTCSFGRTFPWAVRTLPR